MAQSGHAQGHRSVGTCRKRQGHRGQGLATLEASCIDEAENWETDPDYINDNGRQWVNHEISTASIISDLSRSLRDCSFGKSLPPAKTEHAARPRHRPLPCKHSAPDHISLPRGHHAPSRPRTRSLPRLGIERSSLFEHNALEKLDTFFSEKLKAWGSDAVHLSGTSESTEAPLEATPGHHRPPRNATGKGEDTTDGRGRQLKPSWATRVRGHKAAGPGQNPPEKDGPGAFHDPGRMLLQPSAAGKREDAGGRFWKGSPAAGRYSSARILPQCRISHIQGCRACQEFNRDLPPPSGNCWTPLQAEGPGGTAAPHRAPRAGASSLQTTPDRLSKVQQWLEQTPGEPPPGHTRALGHQARHPARGSLKQKEGAPAGGKAREAGGWRSPEACSETRHRRGSRPEEQQPAAAPILPSDATSTSPATCSCLFCEQQRPGARLVPGHSRADPSAEEVAVQLQAENRIPRIVEAFERRSLKEAKLAQRDRDFCSARTRPPQEKGKATKTHRATKRGHRASSAKARTSLSKEELHEPPRTPGHRGTEGERLRPQPSFLDRLRGLH